MPNEPALTILRASPKTNSMIKELPALMHVHVPKCAGTLFDHLIIALADAYGRTAHRFSGTIYGQQFAGKGKQDARTQVANFAFPAKWFYASGHLPMGSFPASGDPYRTIAILREPLARQLSMFEMGVARGFWSATATIDELMTNGWMSANSMVRQLSGETDARIPLGAEHLDRALQNFRQLSYRGLIDRFDEILTAIMQDYGVPYLAYQRPLSPKVSIPDRDALKKSTLKYLDLDLEFFGRAAREVSTASKMPVTSVADIPAGSKILVASAIWFSGVTRAKVIPIETLRSLVAGKAGAQRVQ